jgi:hypothetical protein
MTLLHKGLWPWTGTAGEPGEEETWDRCAC